jgi:peroxiredoxin
MAENAPQVGPLQVGQMAPDFTLLNQDKNPVKLSDYRGKKKVMLLFYPMDFSPICTQEHCLFGPAFDRLNGPDAETVVFGVSTDNPFCHAAFRKQYSIPYDLLADTNRKVVKAYGLFAGEEPYNCGKRGTVIIDKAGKVAFYKEQPMKEPRSVEELEKAALVDDLLAQRDAEGGERISASR